MSGRPSKFSEALALLDDGTLDIEAAVADGLQDSDQPVIEQGLANIRAGLVEVGDVRLDIRLAMRTINVGRQNAWDERYKALDASQTRLRIEETQTKAPERRQPSGDLGVKQCA